MDLSDERTTAGTALVELKDRHNRRRINEHMRRKGVIGPDMDPGIPGAYGQGSLDHTRPEMASVPSAQRPMVTRMLRGRRRCLTGVALGVDVVMMFSSY